MFMSKIVKHWSWHVHVQQQTQGEIYESKSENYNMITKLLL